MVASLVTLGSAAVEFEAPFDSMFDARFSVTVESEGSVTVENGTFGSEAFRSEALFDSISSSDGSWFDEWVISGMSDSKTSDFGGFLDSPFSSTGRSDGVRFDELESIAVECGTLDSEAIASGRPFDSIFSIVEETTLVAVRFDSVGSEVSSESISSRDST